MIFLTFLPSGIPRDNVRYSFISRCNWSAASSSLFSGISVTCENIQFQSLWVTEVVPNVTSLLYLYYRISHIHHGRLLTFMMCTFFIIMNCSRCSPFSLAVLAQIRFHLPAVLPQIRFHLPDWWEFALDRGSCHLMKHKYQTSCITLHYQRRGCFTASWGWIL